MTTCPELQRLARQLTGDDASAALLAKYTAHRATCPTCQAHERAAREQWERLRGKRVTARRDDTREYREERP